LVSIIRDVNQQYNTNFKVLFYIHTSISNERNSTTKYANDRMLTNAGTQISYGGDPQFPQFYITTTNQYGGEIDKVMDSIMDEFDTDGIFWEESQYSTMKYNYDGTWDNVTVDLNFSNYIIKAKLAALPLLQLQKNIQIIDKIKQTGGELVCNEPPFLNPWSNQVSKHPSAIHFYIDLFTEADPLHGECSSWLVSCDALFYTDSIKQRSWPTATRVGYRRGSKYL
jgi:hypothetical protein